MAKTRLCRGEMGASGLSLGNVSLPARSPPSPLHAVLSITLDPVTLTLHLGRAAGSPFHPAVPGGSLRVKCQRPIPSHSRNEYEMIQRGCLGRVQGGTQTDAGSFSITKWDHIAPPL